MNTLFVLILFSLLTFNLFAVIFKGRIKSTKIIHRMCTSFEH